MTIVDDGLLRQLVGTDDPSAIKTFNDGGLVTTSRATVRAGSTQLVLRVYGRHGPVDTWRVPAVAVPKPPAGSVPDRLATTYTHSWISRRTAIALGMRVQPTTALVATSRPVTEDDLARLSVYGLSAFSGDPASDTQSWVAPAAVAGAGLLTAMIAGMTVALSAAEGRSEVATLAAIGASPRRRRAFGAMHGLLLGIVGCLLGMVIGVPAGLSFSQLNGVAGTAVPWLALISLLVALPVFAAAAGWLVTPTRLSLGRRTA